MERESDQSPVPIQETSSDELPSAGSARVNRVRKLLFRRMLVGIKDGRFFLGSFYCVDKQGNIILQDAVEYRSTRRSSPSPMEQRCLGLILIPSSCRSSCHVDCSVEEQLSLLSLAQWEVSDYYFFFYFLVCIVIELRNYEWRFFKDRWFKVYTFMLLRVMSGIEAITRV